MRLIGTLSNEAQAYRLSTYLKRKGIENNCEVASEANGSLVYRLWVHDEDMLQKAEEILAQFQKKPSDPEFDSPVVITLPPVEGETSPLEEILSLRRARSPLTLFFASLCILLFILNSLQERPWESQEREEARFLLTPIQMTLFFDLPPVFGKLEQIMEKYTLSPDQKIEELPPEVKAELQEIEVTPFWRGAYDWLFLKFKGEDTRAVEGPLFYKIRQGDVWRLFTPCLLHGNFLHLLFNMFWLWLLGRPIEQRVGMLRTLVLTLFVGIGSNVFQYLVSGPFFLGYSGIVTGLAGFTWMRERIAPWEGYPMPRSTALFFFYYVGGLFVLQAGAAFLQFFFDFSYMLPIANSAHIAGGLLGIALARLPFFAQRTL